LRRSIGRVESDADHRQQSGCDSIDNVDTQRREAMRVAVKKWGNSASIRIPAPILRAAKVRLEQMVEVREEGGRIIIEPAEPAYDLAGLLAGITPENIHAEFSFGPAVGKEAF
jgi:antitoxin MazE